MSYPNKKTKLPHKIHTLIKKRWSPISLTDKKINKEQIAQLFEAARWAPSSFNAQPWRYIYATKNQKPIHNKLASLLFDGNNWAKEAHLLILICAKTTFEYKNKPNIHHAYDTGAATENLFLQATALGLSAHEMAGFDAKKATSQYKLPKNVIPLAMMAIGHYKKPKDPEQIKREKAPRQRLEQKEFAFNGHFPKNT